jgi:hypothetical protein
VQLHEFWRQEYKADCYLTHLSTSQLSERAKYLIENLTILETSGKIGLIDITDELGQDLMRKFTHVLQEFNHRNEKPNPGFLKSARVPGAMVDKSDRLKHLNQLARDKNPHLIKFGEKKYLEEFSFKVSLASSFNDPSLNAAQMDDEMKALFIPHPNDIKLTRLNGRKIEGILGLNLEMQITRDYYIFCSSHKFDLRLFGDFEADSCLFIYNSQQFADDLFHSMCNNHSIKDHGFKRVTYMDPIRPDSEIRPSIEFHKHIKYLYQNEYRHVFVPKDDNKLLKNIIFNMPEAKTYSELVCL